MTQPTETPPAEGQTHLASDEHANDANSGPVASNRTPMVIGLVALGFVVVCTLVLIVGKIVVAMGD